MVKRDHDIFGAKDWPHRSLCTAGPAPQADPPPEGTAQFTPTHISECWGTGLSGGEQATLGGFIPRRAARRASRGYFFYA